MEEVDIFTSQPLFSGSLRKFLELIDVGGSCDCGVLSQQLPVQNTSCIPQAAGEKRGEACASDDRVSEQLAAHLRAGSRQRVGWRYRRGPSYRLQLSDSRETLCGVDGGEKTDICPFDTIFGNWGGDGESIERGLCGSQDRRDGV